MTRATSLVSRWQQPHHDGSSRFCERASASGEVVVRVLEPTPDTLSECTLRYSAEGDGFRIPCEVERTDGSGRWWRAALPVGWPGTTYRFELGLRRGGSAYLDGRGVHLVEPPDVFDFRVDDRPEAPAWFRHGIIYQVFLDRFCRSGLVDAPDTLAAWTDNLELEWPANVKQFFGGDLWGLADCLPYIEGIGASVLLLTPFFPAPESHRYCATSFDEVDDLLGGGEALAALTAAAHKRGLRVMGDLTLNHCGSEHPWFRRAQADAESAERRLFHFDSWPDRYAAYHDVPSLPRLDYRTETAYERMIDGDEAVTRTWLRPPHQLDGWRLDVAGSVGRLAGQDRNLDVRRRFLDAVLHERSDAAVFGEIPRDPAADLQGDGWPGALLDAGFCTPVRTWLSGAATYGGQELVDALSTFAAQLSWRTLQASVAFIGNHDYGRIASAARDEGALRAAFCLLLTSVSVPLVFAGDEVGLIGETGDDARQPMPWVVDQPAPAGNLDLLSYVRQLSAHRHGSPALREGSFRWLGEWQDAVLFERATASERLVCFAAREDCTLDLPPVFGKHAEELITGGAILTDSVDAPRVEARGLARSGLWRMAAAGSPER